MGIYLPSFVRTVIYSCLKKFSTHFASQQCGALSRQSQSGGPYPNELSLARFYLKLDHVRRIEPCGGVNVILTAVQWPLIQTASPTGHRTSVWFGCWQQLWTRTVRQVKKPDQLFDQVTQTVYFAHGHRSDVYQWNCFAKIAEPTETKMPDPWY